ncbi:hypothetical protein GCM10022226_80810 [Sphaerisporangium flaviroseum]|uniref:Secreted protein n=1 Tax=Sphaerisporangium flaviroseum TaxID=509199 RepID=A0ABP7JIU8_9ACTN
MVSRRPLALLGPALLSLTLWPGGAAQASADPASTHTDTARAPAATPGDPVDYREGFTDGYQDGRRDCEVKSPISRRDIGLLEGDYEIGYTDGYDSGRTACRDRSDTRDEDES